MAGAPLLLSLPGGSRRPGAIREMEAVLSPEERFARKLARPEWDAFCGNAAAIVESAGLHFGHDDPDAAERWLRYGAEEVRQPAVMLCYGDYLASSRPEEARLWYRRAAATVTDPGDPAQAAFLEAVRIRLTQEASHANP